MAPSSILEGSVPFAKPGAFLAFRVFGFRAPENLAP